MNDDFTGSNCGDYWVTLNPFKEAVYFVSENGMWVFSPLVTSERSFGATPSALTHYFITAVNGLVGADLPLEEILVHSLTALWRWQGLESCYNVGLGTSRHHSVYECSPI